MRRHAKYISKHKALNINLFNLDKVEYGIWDINSFNISTLMGDNFARSSYAFTSLFHYKWRTRII